MRMYSTNVINLWFFQEFLCHLTSHEDGGSQPTTFQADTYTSVTEPVGSGSDTGNEKTESRLMNLIEQIKTKEPDPEPSKISHPDAEKSVSPDCSEKPPTESESGNYSVERGQKRKAEDSFESVPQRRTKYGVKRTCNPDNFESHGGYPYIPRQSGSYPYTDYQAQSSWYPTAPPPHPGYYPGYPPQSPWYGNCTEYQAPYPCDPGVPSLLPPGFAHRKPPRPLNKEKTTRVRHHYYQIFSRKAYFIKKNNNCLAENPPHIIALGVFQTLFQKVKLISVSKNLFPFLLTSAYGKISSNLV